MDTTSICDWAGPSAAAVCVLRGGAVRWAERMLCPELTDTGYLGAGGCISCCWRAEICPEPGVAARALGDWGVAS